MQRTVSVLLSSFVAGLLLTGCPEKRVEKEDPAMPPTASDKNGVEEKAAEKAEDEHGEEADEHGEAPKDDQKPVKKHHPDKKAEEKDQGGW